MKPQDIQDLKELIEFLKQYQVAEFDLDRGDIKIRLKFTQAETSSLQLSDLARALASAPHAPAPPAHVATPSASSAPSAPAASP
jgi:acetyl-CoA carboxylase biotin carboxyl carrier protein